MDQNLDNQLRDQATLGSEDSSQNHSQEHAGHVHGPNCSHGHSHAHQHTHDPIVRAEAKVGRNDPCPCGSQQKFKKCHGK